MTMQVDAERVRNIPSACQQIDTPLTQLRSLAVHLGRQYQQLPGAAKPHASNIIQQSRNAVTAADYERLKPWIAESARRFAAALH